MECGAKTESGKKINKFKVVLSYKETLRDAGIGQVKKTQTKQIVDKFVLLFFLFFLRRNPTEGKL